MSTYFRAVHAELKTEEDRPVCHNCIQQALDLNARVAQAISPRLR